MAVISLKNIGFRYDTDEPEIFTDFSLDIDEGECVLVRGDNGCGKTTLFRLLNGLSLPQKGSYEFKGTAIGAAYLKNNANLKRFHKEIGYLFQNPDVMLFNGSVYDEIAFGPRQMGLGEEAVAARVKDCLAMLDIENISGRAPYLLSGGQKKKVALASVIALNPSVYVLDEPFEALDNKSREWLAEFLKSLKRAGKTLLIATHGEDLPEGLADRVVELG